MNREEPENGLTVLLYVAAAIGIFCLVALTERAGELLRELRAMREDIDAIKDDLHVNLDAIATDVRELCARL